MELGYARVSTAEQDLERQVDALTATGIPAERIFVDTKSGAHTDRPGLTALLDHAREGDVIGAWCTSVINQRADDGPLCPGRGHTRP